MTVAGVLTLAERDADSDSEEDCDAERLPLAARDAVTDSEANEEAVSVSDELELAERDAERDCEKEIEAVTLPLAGSEEVTLVLAEVELEAVRDEETLLLKVGNHVELKLIDMEADVVTETVGEEALRLTLAELERDPLALGDTAMLTLNEEDKDGV